MNQASKQAGLVLNANKTKKRFQQQYESLELKNLRFRGGSSSYVYVTSMIEQVFETLLKDISRTCANMYDDENDKKIDVEDATEINRDQIENLLKKNNDFKLLFKEELIHSDKDNDGSEYSTINQKILIALLDAYMPENISLSKSAGIYIRYLVHRLICKCVTAIIKIKKNATQKSITVAICKSALDILFGDKLYKKYDPKATKAIKIKIKDDSDDESDSDDKPKKKLKKSKKDDSDEESEDDKPKKKLNKSKKDDSDEESDED